MENGLAEQEVYEAKPMDEVDSSNPFANPETYTEDTSASFLEPLSDSRGAVLDDDVEQLKTEENLKILESIPVKLEEIGDKYWELAELVSKVLNNKLFLIMGYKNYKEYVNEQLKVDRRTGYYWAQMYNYFTNDLKAILANRPELYQKYLQKAKTMGWSKASKIAEQKCITPDNAESLYERLTWDNDTRKEPSFNMVQNVLKSEKEKIPKDISEEMQETDGEAPEMRQIRMSFSLTEAQNNDVEAAFEYAQKIVKQGSKKSTIFSWICRDYLQTNHAAQGKGVDVKTLFQRLEDTTGLNIVALNDKGEKVYGAGLDKEESDS